MEALTFFFYAWCLFLYINDVVSVIGLSLLQILTCIMLIALGNLKNAKSVVIWFLEKTWRIIIQTHMHRYVKFSVICFLFSQVQLCGMYRKFVLLGIILCNWKTIILVDGHRILDCLIPIVQGKLNCEDICWT